MDRRYIFYVLSFGLGMIAYAVFPNLIYLKFDYTYNIANIFNLFVTIVVAFILTIFFNKRSSEKRVEKDIVMKIIQDVLPKLNALKLMLADEEDKQVSFEERNKYVSLFKDISSDIQNIDDCITTYELMKPSENPVKSLNSSLLIYKQSITLDTSKAIDYSTASVKHNEIKSRLFNLLKEINRG